MFPFPKNHTRKKIQEYSKRDLLDNDSNIPCILKTMLLSEMKPSSNEGQKWYKNKRNKLNHHGSAIFTMRYNTTLLGRFWLCVFRHDGEMDNF